MSTFALLFKPKLLYKEYEQKEEPYEVYILRIYDG